MPNDEYRPLALQWERLDPEEALQRSHAFLELMRSRRSVRFFSSDPVPYELIQNAVEVAGTAPSGANQQPWTFVVVSDPETKRRIREAAEAEERTFYERRAPDEYKRAIKPIGTDAVKPHITDAPYLIVVFERVYRLGDDGAKGKHYFVKESVGIAVGFLLAALHASGLVALTHSPSPMGFLSEILERPANERPFILIPVGYPADGSAVPDIERKPLDEILVQR
jgi:iodotyrosine deiodinase